MLDIPSRVIAACFSLVGFAAAAVVGIAVGNETTTILLRATGVMFVAWVVGWMLGGIAQGAIREHLDAYKAAHPIPSDTVEEADDRPGADSPSESVIAS